MKSRRRNRRRKSTFRANPVRRKARRRNPVRARRRRRSSFRANPVRRRRSFRRNPVRSRKRRRSGGGGGGFSLNSIKNLFNKDNIKTGVGVVAATGVTRLALNKFGASLPGMSATATAQTKQIATVIYLALIPGLVGIAVRKFDRAISDGLIIGGIANAAIGAVNAFAPTTAPTLGLSEYLDARPMRSLSAPITAPGYGGIRAFGAGNGGSVLESASAFKRSNW